MRISSRIYSLQQWFEFLQLRGNHVGGGASQSLKHCASQRARQFARAHQLLELCRVGAESLDLLFKFSPSRCFTYACNS